MRLWQSLLLVLVEFQCVPRTRPKPFSKSRTGKTLSSLSIEREPALVSVRVDVTLTVDFEFDLWKWSWRRTRENLASPRVEDTSVTGAEVLLWIALPSSGGNFVEVDLAAEVRANRVEGCKAVWKVYQDCRSVLMGVLEEEALAYGYIFGIGDSGSRVCDGASFVGGEKKLS